MSQDEVELAAAVLLGTEYLVETVGPVDTHHTNHRQDMAQRQEQFQQEAYQSMQKAQQDAMTPIYKKLDEAIQAVGKAEGVVYIFDLARTPIPYVGAQSVDVTAKVKTQLGIK